MHEFSLPRYSVDILKVGLPVNIAFVQGLSASKADFVYTRVEALELIRRAAASAAKPFLYLSGGVSNRDFRAALELAAEAGARFCGVLCGRATWKDGVGIFVRDGTGALQQWLETQGVQNIRTINEGLKQATPWPESYSGND